MGPGVLDKRGEMGAKTESWSLHREGEGAGVALLGAAPQILTAVRGR